MDESLLRQREAFKQRAMTMPVVERSTVRKDTSRKESATTSKKLHRPSSSTSSKPIPSLYSKPSVNKHKFGLLAQLVNHMKSRHQNGFTHALTLDEMLEECNMETTISTMHKHWLLNEALVNNPKIQVISEGAATQFSFKPKYNIKDKKALLKLLDRHDQRGLGGIRMEDIEEGLPRAKKCIKLLGDKILFVTRPDKKQIVFYNDKSCEFPVDEEFQQLWRSVTVDSIDDEKIEEYLNSHGITSMQDNAVKKPAVQKRKKTNRKRKFKTHNDHLDGLLEDYSEKSK
nr:general transcription factor IIE subunit 2-like [Ciona intestinalis]|eukprot:XP_002128543.1 general transcription factor IIE subunit 2-like [Ciona intestinalis]